jgi:hypothetical protein
MDEHRRRRLEPRDKIHSQSRTTLVTTGVTGTVLLLGAGAVYFLTQASPEALATVSRVLITTGLVGLLVMTFVVAARSSPSGPEDGGGPGTRRQPQPTTVRPATDPEAELLRILDDPRLGDLAAAHRVGIHDRRSGAA